MESGRSDRGQLSDDFYFPYSPCASPLSLGTIASSADLEDVR
jgi:hypothetical protein